MSDDTMIALRDGSFVRPSYVKAVLVHPQRADREYLPGNPASVCVILASGTYSQAEMWSTDAAKVEAARIAGLCSLATPPEDKP